MTTKGGAAVDIDYVSLAAVAAGLVGVLGYYAYRTIRYKGFKAGIFGAEIVETIGEISGPHEGIMGSVSLKVHTLSSTDTWQGLVGLERVRRSTLFHNMALMKLERSEARKLISLLERAVSKAVI